MGLTSWEWEHFIGSFAEIWCTLSQRPTHITDYCGQGHTGNRNWSVDIWGKMIRSIGYVYGQEVVASHKEKRTVFRAELPQNRYLTYASLVQVQLPDSRIGKQHVTCCAPVLVEVDRELGSRSKAYSMTHLLLTPPVPVAWMQAWVSQSKHVHLLPVALVMKNKWGLLPTLDMGNPEVKQIRSRFIIALSHLCITHHCFCMWHLDTFPGDCMLLFNVMSMGWVMAWTIKLKKYIHVHITAKLLQMKERALSLNIQLNTNI